MNLSSITKIQIFFILNISCLILRTNKSPIRLNDKIWYKIDTNLIIFYLKAIALNSGTTLATSTLVSVISNLVKLYIFKF